MQKDRRNLYEGIYILIATLSEDARQKALDKITSSIVAKGGEIKKLFDHGRRKIAYEMEGRKEGHYFVIYFDAPSSSIKSLWNEYHLNEDLIRFMTFRSELSEAPEKIETAQLAEV